MIKILKRDAGQNRPCLPGQYVDRPRITELLCKSTEQNLITYVNSPFDYGKTTAAVAFANEIDCVWYSITKKFIDEDKLNSLITNKKSLLILDNFDYLTEKYQNKLVSLLIDRKIHCMILSRSYIPILLQTSPLCYTVDKNELMFTEEELVEYGKLCFPIATEEQMYTVAELSSGWLPGFEIGVNIMLRGSAENSNELLNQSLVEIWHTCDDEFWGIMTPLEKEFLLSVGCFREISVEMALLVTGIADCLDVFSSIMAKSSCYVDKKNGIYYIHELILDYLVVRRNEILSKEERNRIWKSAGGYYYLHGKMIKALNCYKQADEYGIIAHILEDSLSGKLNVSAMWELRDYFEILSDEIIESSPKLCAARVILNIFAFRLVEAEKWKNKLDILAKTFSDDDLEKKQAESLLLYLNIGFPNSCETKNVINLMKDAVKTIKLKDLETYEMPLTANRPSVLSGIIDFSPYIKGSVNLCKSISDLLYDLYGKESIGAVNLAMGEVFYYQDKLSEALLEIIGAIVSIERYNSPYLFFVAQCMQFEIMMVSGQLTNTDVMLANIEQKIHDLDAECLMPNFNAIKIWVSLYNKQPCNIDTWLAEEVPDESDNFCILNIFQYFIKLRVYILKELYLLFAALESRLRQACIAFGRKIELIELDTLAAIAYEKMGEREKAMTYLEEALISSEKYDYIRIIADEGACVYELLRIYAKGKPKVKAEYLTAVTKAAKRMGLRFPNYLKNKLPDAPKLTGTEIDVLTMMAHDKTNAEISQYLGITINTVKFHSKNIFGKLCVNNRRLAVENAREQHLIDL